MPQDFSHGTIIHAPYALLPNRDYPGGFRVAEWILVYVVRRDGDEWVCWEPHYGEIRYKADDPATPLHRADEASAMAFRQQTLTGNRYSNAYVTDRPMSPTEHTAMCTLYAGYVQPGKSMW